jgi:hypothetical protein
VIFETLDMTTTTTLTTLLETSARAQACTEFVALVEAVDWAERQPNELLKAIDLALDLDMTALAISLAQQGGQIFPDNERVQQMARRVSPLGIQVDRDAPHHMGIKQSSDWLNNHADEYRGQWVAIREGILIAAAPTLAELETLMGDNDDHTLVTRVRVV